MPIYEYHCAACGRNFEVLQKISEPRLASCPGCGKKVKRLISRTSFALKGGGWYKDGYSTGSSGTADKTASKDGGKKADKPEKKADAAPPKKDS